MHFCPHLCTPGKTFRSVIHPEIALGQARLTLKLFTLGLSEKKVYINDMSILSILLKPSFKISHMYNIQTLNYNHTYHHDASSASVVRVYNH
jgi:hypothetical protein